MFKKPGEESDDDDVGPTPSNPDAESGNVASTNPTQYPAAPVIEEQRIIIHEDD